MNVSERRKIAEQTRWHRSRFILIFFFLNKWMSNNTICNSLQIEYSYFDSVCTVIALFHSSLPVSSRRNKAIYVECFVYLCLSLQSGRFTKTLWHASANERLWWEWWMMSGSGSVHEEIERNLCYVRNPIQNIMSFRVKWLSTYVFAHAHISSHKLTSRLLCCSNDVSCAVDLSHLLYCTWTYSTSKCTALQFMGQTHCWTVMMPLVDACVVSAIVPTNPCAHTECFTSFSAVKHNLLSSLMWHCCQALGYLSQPAAATEQRTTANVHNSDKQVFFLMISTWIKSDLSTFYILF